jgi:hypothetical protein
VVERLSLNVWTTKNWTLAQAVAGCVAQGVPGIGLWRDKVAEHGLDAAAKLVREAGLTVTSLCRGGFFTSPGSAADNRAAVDECVALGTDVLVLVVGGLPEGSKDLPSARAAVIDGIAELAPYAEANGVKLAIEPLHPMFCADRAVVSTLGQAPRRRSAGPAAAASACAWTPTTSGGIRRCSRRSSGPARRAGSTRSRSATSWFRSRRTRCSGAATWATA